MSSTTQPTRAATTHHRGLAAATSPLPRGRRFAAVRLTLVGSLVEANAADASCTAVIKAANAGLAQLRIHAAIDTPPDPEAVKAGFKPTLMHSIVIDQVQYSNAIRAGFSRTPLESKDMRMLATDLGPFMVEEGCKPAGSETLAGRDTLVFTAQGDLGRGEIRFKLWVDKATGLPLRAVSDEPDVDVETLFNALDKKKGRPAVQAAEKPNAKRNIATHAYLFGAAVKPPGPQGAIDAAALASLLAVLKGNR
jgi:hypothetical protein